MSDLAKGVLDNGGQGVVVEVVVVDLRSEECLALGLEPLVKAVAAATTRRRRGGRGRAATRRRRAASRSGDTLRVPLASSRAVSHTL